MEERNLILDKLSSVEFGNFISKFNISTVVIFGSICNDEFNELSDVDIAILGKNQIPLEDILEIELFLEEFLQREIDVVDLRNFNLDLFIKINILNCGNVVYSTDNKELFEEFCGEIHRIYTENENFMYFRRMDVLS